MITVSGGSYFVSGEPAAPQADFPAREAARGATMAYQILSSHDQGGGGTLRLRFDKLISHDITYVGIVQTARASGMREFPLPYVLTNCHNSLCAVGGTINEDDHAFGLSAAIKYGGIYVPKNLAVIHQYARECLAAVGQMILGSDSHTRYGALGTLSIGEGGPELVKQLLQNTYDVQPPEVVAVYLSGAPRHGVGPHDVMLALCRAVYEQGLVKNRILEFVGPGLKNLSMDFRIGMDVMTTETACLSSIWPTDETVKRFYARHGRPEDFRPLAPGKVCYYDRVIRLPLDKIEPMIALPYHPSNALPIREFLADAADILHALNLDGKATKKGVLVDQGVIAGCAGGLYENIAEAAQILKGGSIGDGYFNLSIYPPSAPVDLALSRAGILQTLKEAGAVIEPCFCGPCFGAGEVPSNGALSIRHTTRNFPNREGSKPGEGQRAAVALMDARSIAATALNGGYLASAADLDYEAPGDIEYPFEGGVYGKRVYNGYGRPEPARDLRFGPNIADWPKIEPMGENLLLEIACALHDPVTTTDELIPSGETSSYRSNPLRLAEFTLSRREPAYLGRAKAVREAEQARLRGEKPAALLAALNRFGDGEALLAATAFASCVAANVPGDGSAREQAASCQRVLGGGANIALAYATKRYRSNLINWGMLPFTLAEGATLDFAPGDLVFVPGIAQLVRAGAEEARATVCGAGGSREITLYMKNLTADEREILLAGCLMNHYARLSGRA